MLITEKWLNDKEACAEGIQWWKSLNTEKPEEIFRAAKTEEEFNYCVWLIQRIFNKKQSVPFSIFCAEKVLYFWEEKYPEDTRPHKAIEAAKKYISTPCKKTKEAAYAASRAASEASFASAASAAAAAAANASRAASEVSFAYAADTAANAAYAAYWAAAKAAKAADWASVASAVESLRQEILEEAARIISK